MANRATYLADWTGDNDPGQAIPQDAPVTSVSWFAARAYCASLGKRLPTIAEWEYVAAANNRELDAARQPEFIQELVSLYASRPRVLSPVYVGRSNIHGVRGLHDLVSEWVDDFNSVLVSDDSRGVGGRDHDMFCASAAIGAVDANNYPAFLRYALRAGLSGRSTLQSLGFRCAA
jgi:formylglycine-generating enzyme required for sulfatase activity